MVDLALFENQVAFLTLRIETKYPNNTRGFGTGFIFQFPGVGANAYFVLVTNRHVIEGVSEITLVLTRQHTDGTPNLGDKFRCKMDTATFSLKAFHPNPDIDLAIIALGPALKECASGGNAAYVKAFKPDQIASKTARQNMRSVENILMVGYPNGLWDSLNNVPIVRRGITATPLHLDHEGKPEFMIDAPCFPGSSGSPVIRYDSGCYLEAMDTKFGTRAELVGILYAGPLLQADGTVTRKPIPTHSVKPEDLKIMINLGYCIHAQEIEGFRSVLQSWGAVFPES